jgi:hypothetical protein
MTDKVPPDRRCPACGSALGGPSPIVSGSPLLCSHCHRPAVAVPPMDLDLAETVEYEFDDVTASERAEATDLLVAAGVAYRWEPGFLLQVPAYREHDVDAIFGHLSPEDAGPDGLDGRPLEQQEDRPALDTNDNADGLGADRESEPEEWIADEEAVGALANLFDAADRLRHHPEDDDATAVLADATGVVATASVPLGLSPVLWETAAYLGRQLLGLVERGASGEDVTAGADALRAVLRDHV